MCIVEDTLPGALCGYYDDTQRVIHVDSRLSYRQRRCVLAHELWHAFFHHGSTVHVYAVKDELRVRRLTARLLISDDQYAMVEAMFDAEPYAMAQELEVTQQVLQDFQSLLKEHSDLCEVEMLGLPVVVA